MRVIVFGGRDFNRRKLVFKALDQIHKKYNITCVIDGEARGADTLGHEWAVQNNIPTERYAADWATYGRSAGIVRNVRMTEESNPDMGIAFPGGNGTYHMKKTLKDLGIKVISVQPVTMR